MSHTATTVKDIIAYLHSQQEQKEEAMLKAVGLIDEKDLSGNLPLYGGNSLTGK
jgi:hypothetical protein